MLRDFREQLRQQQDVKRKCHAPNHNFRLKDWSVGLYSPKVAMRNCFVPTDSSFSPSISGEALRQVSFMIVTFVRVTTDCSPWDLEVVCLFPRAMTTRALLSKCSSAGSHSLPRYRFIHALSLGLYILFKMWVLSSVNFVLLS